MYIGNERDEYYYAKGKLDGYKEGTRAAQELVTKFFQNQANPDPIVISGKDINLSRLIKEIKTTAEETD
jgi:flagellar biosynthesis/type III secretory pathway protein FliH